MKSLFNRAGNKEQHITDRLRRATLEVLEDRRLMSGTVATWIGGSSANWSDTANWQGGQLPASGQDVVFPAQASTSQVSVTDDVNATIGNLSLLGNYRIGASGSDTLTVNGDITVNSASQSSQYIFAPITITHDTTLDGETGLGAYSIGESGGHFKITKTGAGSTNLNLDTTTGALTIQAGDVALPRGGTAPIVVGPNGTLDVIRSQTSATTVNGIFSLGISDESGGITFNSTATFAELLYQGSSSSSTGVLQANGGPINLGGTLQVSPLSTSGAYQAQYGQPITLIGNQTGTAVVGTFANLPEGATFQANGITFKISYQGGTSGQDVTITPIQTVTWTGGGTDNDWSDADNWSGDAVPTSGDNIVFPAPTSSSTSGSSATQVFLDTAATVNDITFNGDYELGNGENDSLSVAGTVSAQGNDTIDGSVTMIANDTVNVGTGDTLTTFGLGDGTYGVTKTGAGNLNLTGSSHYSGATTINGGSISIYGYFGSPVVVNSGGLFSGVGIVPGMTVSGGSVMGGSSSMPFLLQSSDGLTMDSASTFDSKLFAAGSSPQANGMDFSDGTIALGNATLSLSRDGTLPQVGDVYTLIKNETDNAVTGTFNGLAEGSTATVDGVTYRISYTGGDSQKDVTATVTALPSSTGTGTTPTGTTGTGTTPTGTTGTGTVGTTPTTTTSTTPTVARAMAALSTSSVRPSLSVLGADTAAAGEAGLTYTWSVSHAPSGAKAVTFGDSGTNSAKSTTVRVRKDGTYVLNCTITNAAGNSVTTRVSLTIRQVATTLSMTPSSASVKRGAKQQFAATALDQFGTPMRASTTTKFKVTSGTGTITSAGLFTAGNKKGKATIQLTVAGLTGTANVTIA